MERELTLKVGINDDGWPYINVVDVEGGRNLTAIGYGKTYSGGMDRLKQKLWDMVSLAVNEMQD